MKNKVLVSILIAMLFVAVIGSLFLNVNAATDSGDGGTGTSGSGFDFSGKVNTLMNKTGNDKLNKKTKSIAGTAITITQVIAVGVAIIMLIVLAMKYMTSAPGDRATIKKHAVVYVVGALIMFGSTGILEIIRVFATSFEGSVS